VPENGAKNQAGIRPNITKKVIFVIFEKGAQPSIFHKATQKPTNAKIAIAAIIISNELGLLDFVIQPPGEARSKHEMNPECQTQDLEKLRFSENRYRCASTIRRRTGKSVFGISTAV
jgi:hypothetical protein